MALIQSSKTHLIKAISSTWGILIRKAKSCILIHIITNDLTHTVCAIERDDDV